MPASGKGHDTTIRSGTTVKDPKGGHLSMKLWAKEASQGGRIAMHLYYDPNQAECSMDATPREATI